jgi:hypothetical protein
MPLNTTSVIYKAYQTHQLAQVLKFGKGNILSRSTHSSEIDGGTTTSGGTTSHGNEGIPPTKLPSTKNNNNNGENFHSNRFRNLVTGCTLMTTGGFSMNSLIQKTTPDWIYKTAEFLMEPLDWHPETLLVSCAGGIFAGGLTLFVDAINDYRRHHKNLHG